MIFKVKSLFLFIICLFLFGSFFIVSGVKAAEYDYDLAIGQGDVTFSEEVLISGTTVRIYAKVKNVGNKDMVGYVSFFRGMELIGNSQAVSVLPGSNDDVFVDFIIPQDSFNVLARIQGTEPADQNSGNNETQTALIIPDKDTDSDGTVDRLDNDDDNDGSTDAEEQSKGTDPLKADTDSDGYNDKIDYFPLNSSEWLDTDADGIGNNADVDDDNDGWSDSQEQSRGTDPLRKDTDGDGVNDPQDYYPLDPLKSVQEETRNIFQPAALNNNANQNVAAAPEPNQNINQPIATLQDLQEQLDSITASEETSKKLENQPLEKINEVVEKVSGTSKGFFRFNNYLMWLILAIVIVAAAAVYVFIKSGKSGRKPLDSLMAEKPRVKSSAPAIISPPADTQQPTRKLPPNVINLKDLNKRK